MDGQDGLGTGSLKLRVPRPMKSNTRFYSKYGNGTGHSREYCIVDRYFEGSWPTVPYIWW